MDHWISFPSTTSVSSFRLYRSTVTDLPNFLSHQTLKKDEFYALLSVADLAVITPLRDGMNTTSMEFVIAQNETNKSPSVLSEFMGISKNMEDALLVNPWNLGVCDGACWHIFVTNLRGPGRRGRD